MRIWIGGAMAALTLFASVALWSRHDAGNRRESADEVASKAETGGENIPVTSLSGGGVSVPMDSIAESARMENIPPTTLASAKSEIGGVMSEKTKADFAFLLGTNPPPGTDVQAWRAEKNAIMDAWGSQKETSGDLAGVLVAISTDANQDVVVRDYALQHMVSIYSSAVSDRVRMQDALYQALDEKQTSLPGTALLALNRLARKYPDVDVSRLEMRALALAGDEDCGAMGRATAFQVCAAMDATEVVPIARAVMDAPGSPFLRRSARTALEKMSQAHSELVAAIGTMSPQEDCHDCP